MGLRHALAVLAEQWDDIGSRLSPGEFDEVAALVVEFTREDDRVASEEIAEEVGDLLRTRLPVEHPFRVALREREERLATAPSRRAAELAQWLELADPLRARLREPSSAAKEVERASTARLLAAPALSADELRGGDSEDPDLIRLDDADGAGRWPAFQFAADGSPVPIVRTVNRILGASEDPLGVADWWLGENGWLGGVPARLVGTLPGDQLIAAARAATAGE